MDGTLARYEPGDGIGTIGEPIPAMVARVKYWLELGVEVRIVTARVGQQFTGTEYGDLHLVRHQRNLIRQWCLKHVGRTLLITDSKDFQMVELWDDRAITVTTNQGVMAAGCQPHSPQPV